MQLLKMAKNRLAKFYAPKEYVPETLIQESSSSEEASDAHRAAPPPPPEAMGAYKKKNDEGGGVMQMMDTLMADLNSEIAEMNQEEKDAQFEYEEMMQNAKKKRTADSKSIAEKEGTKAETEVLLQKMSTEHGDFAKELQATEKIIKDLHGECDWLMSNYDVRKAARDSETEALHKTQSILSGANFD